jgi:hypothetical protein
MWRLSKLRRKKQVQVERDRRFAKDEQEERIHFDLKVQIMSGRIVTVMVSPDDTIHAVSRKIEMKEGINPDQMIILFNGRILSFLDHIYDYDIRECSVLYLILKNVGG